MKSSKKKDKRKKNNKNQKRRATAVLAAIPPGFLDDLPTEDQEAISEIVGKPVRLRGYDEDGRVELQFKDRSDVMHVIWVDPKFVKARA
jgi:hypothetical protein